MRTYTSSLVCSALIVLSVSVVAAQSAFRLDGKWQGTIADKSGGSRQLQSGSPQSPITVVISTASDGKYVGKWWSPAGSKPSKSLFDIGGIAIDGDAVRIELPSSHGVWEGKLSSDGLTLAGEWRKGVKTTPLILRRTGNADEPVRIDTYSPGTVIRR